MSLPEVKHCPDILVKGHDYYSRTCLQRMFDGRQVSHFLIDSVSLLSRQKAVD